jgi:hypothetical protein
MQKPKFEDRLLEVMDHFIRLAICWEDLEFRALHKELVESGKMSNIQFHDRILKENNMPVEMVRALLTNQVLTEDFSTKWKFAGLVN